MNRTLNLGVVRAHPISSGLLGLALLTCACAPEDAIRDSAPSLDVSSADDPSTSARGPGPDTPGPRHHVRDHTDTEHIPESEFDLTYSDPTSVTHWVESGDARFGFSDKAGGYMSCLLPNHRGVLPERCDSLAGDPNLGAPDYGRGWQSAFRDDLHRGRHNPTQAGYDDSWGVPVNLRKGESCGGPGGRVYIAPFRMPIFSNGKYDWVENEDICPDPYDDDRDTTDNDGIDESGLSQLDEVQSEWTYSGYYEDISDRVRAEVGAIRHVYQTEYRHAPDAILQFGESGVMDNRKPPVDTRAIWLDLAPDEGAPESLQGPQVATLEDYATPVFGYSGRVRWSFGYNNVLWVDSEGQWQEDQVLECNKKILVQYGEDQHADLYDGDLTDLLGSNPSRQTDLPLMLLSAGGVDEVDTAEAVGVYMPENRCNTNQVVGIDPDTGEQIYAQDRRARVVFSANHRACKTGTSNETRLVWEDPEGIEPDVYIENDQTNIAIRSYLTGMLNPENAPEGVIERMRLDVTLLLGTPTEILAAVAQLEDARSREHVSCEVTPTCER
jgi:hypothetical protein